MSNVEVNAIKKCDDDSKVLGVVDVNTENVTWDELESTYNEMAEDIIVLQMTIEKMVKENEKAIDTNKETYEIVVGLMKTIGDVAYELKDIKSRYTETTGVIDPDDEEGNILYVQVMNDYITAGEKLSVLTSTAITDILIKLNISDELTIEAINTQNEIIGGIENSTNSEGDK